MKESVVKETWYGHLNTWWLSFESSGCSSVKNHFYSNTHPLNFHDGLNNVFLPQPIGTFLLEFQDRVDSFLGTFIIPFNNNVLTLFVFGIWKIFRNSRKEFSEFWRRVKHLNYCSRVKVLRDAQWADSHVSEGNSATAVFSYVSLGRGGCRRDRGCSFIELILHHPIFTTPTTSIHTTIQLCPITSTQI